MQLIMIALYTCMITDVACKAICNMTTTHTHPVKTRTAARRHRQEQLYVSVVAAVSMLFVCFGWKYKPKHSEGQDYGQKVTVSPLVLNKNRDTMLGDSSAPFTLVEFGDYQCPPCRAINSKLVEFIHSNPKYIRLDFRNLPWTSIHDHALEAAIFAEESRHSSNFWGIHDKLLKVDMDGRSIKNSLEALAITEGAPLSELNTHKREAEASIKADMALAKKLDVDATPTLLLCDPSRQVFNVATVEQIRNHITRFQEAPAGSLK